MSDQTSNLQLPFLAHGQAQKHVTVNESLLRLDALVQLAVVSATIAAQPSGPSDGQVYILPAGKTGADWGAMANLALAYYRDGIWEQIIPREGWTAFVKDADQLLYYTGAIWSLFPPAKILTVSATDKVLGRVSSGAGAAEEVSFTDQAQALCDDTSFGAMVATLGALAKSGDTMTGNLAISKATPVFSLTDTNASANFSIFNLGAALYVERPGGGNSFIITGSSVEFGAHALPAADNSYNLGSASRRYGTVYAATGTINTSDAREKTPLRGLSAAERAAIRRVIASVGVFQWLGSISEKGADAARLHAGVTAQAVKQAFEAEGLDPHRYGLFCADPLSRDEEVEHEVDGASKRVREPRPAVDGKGEPELRLGVRVDQLLMMAMAAMSGGAVR